MASAEELVAHIEVGKSQVGEDKAAITQTASGVDATVTQITAAKSHAEELSQQLQGMNISDKASQALEVASKLDEAIAQAGTVKSQAEQVNTAADTVNAKLDEAITAAQSLMGLSNGGSSGTAHPAPPNRTSTSDPEPIATTGEPLEEPAEIADGSGESSRASRLSRLGQVAARNGDEVVEQNKKLTNDIIQAAQSFLRDPPADQPVPQSSATTTNTVQPTPSIERAGDSDIAPGDVTSSLTTAVLGGVILYKRYTLGKQLREGHHDDN